VLLAEEASYSSTNSVPVPHASSLPSAVSRSLMPVVYRVAAADLFMLLFTLLACAAHPRQMQLLLTVAAVYAPLGP